MNDDKSGKARKGTVHGLTGSRVTDVMMILKFDISRHVIVSLGWSGLIITVNYRPKSGNLSN